MSFISFRLIERKIVDPRLQVGFVAAAVFQLYFWKLSRIVARHGQSQTESNKEQVSVSVM